MLYRLKRSEFVSIRIVWCCSWFFSSLNENTGHPNKLVFNFSGKVLLHRDVLAEGDFVGANKTISRMYGFELSTDYRQFEPPDVVPLFLSIVHKIPFCHPRLNPFRTQTHFVSLNKMVQARQARPYTRCRENGLSQLSWWILSGFCFTDITLHPLRVVF